MLLQGVLGLIVSTGREDEAATRGHDVDGVERRLADLLACAALHGYRLVDAADDRHLAVERLLHLAQVGARAALTGSM